MLFKRAYLIDRWFKTHRMLSIFKYLSENEHKVNYSNWSVTSALVAFHTPTDVCPPTIPFLHPADRTAHRRVLAHNPPSFTPRTVQPTDVFPPTIPHSFTPRIVPWNGSYNVVLWRTVHGHNRVRTITITRATRRRVQYKWRQICKNSLVITLTVSVILRLQIIDLEKVGQGH